MADIASIEQIPAATPYPWGPDETPARRPNTRAAVGTGYVALQKRLQRSGVSDKAKEIVQAFLQKDNRILSDANADGYAVTEHDDVEERYTVDIDPNMTVSGQEDKILALAQEGKVSLFGSILRVIEASSSPVSTRHLLRTCCLAIRPGDVPPYMDCKEMVMAALHFMSSSTQKTSTEEQEVVQNAVTETLVGLPLIDPMQEDIDLEKRLYEKHTTGKDAKPWLLSDPDFRKRLRRLELVFMTSCSTKRNYASRERYCPRLAKDDEKILVFKGTLPPAASASSSRARKSGDSARKRKLTTLLTPSEPAVLVLETA